MRWLCLKNGLSYKLDFFHVVYIIHLRDSIHSYGCVKHIAVCPKKLPILNLKHVKRLNWAMIRRKQFDSVISSSLTVCFLIFIQTSICQSDYLILFHKTSPEYSDLLNCFVSDQFCNMIETIWIILDYCWVSRFFLLKSSFPDIDSWFQSWANWIKLGLPIISYVDFIIIC